MLKFRNSNLNKLISSLDEFACLNKKYSQAQTKTFEILNEWAHDTNNTAIQDVTSKLATLYTNSENNMKEERIGSFNKISEMFNKFKEYDLKIEKYHQNVKIAEKIEKKTYTSNQKVPGQ